MEPSGISPSGTPDKLSNNTRDAGGSWNQNPLSSIWQLRGGACSSSKPQGVENYNLSRDHSREGNNELGADNDSYYHLAREQLAEQMRRDPLVSPGARTARRGPTCSKTQIPKDENMDLPCSVGMAQVEDIPLPSNSRGPVKKEVDPSDGDGPAEVLAWLADAHKHFASKFGPVDTDELEGMISLYLGKVTSCISKCYVPNRAAKMKRCIGDMLHFFYSQYREIPEIDKTYSTYMDKMTELLAFYIDMEIQASSRAKEAPLSIACRLTMSLYMFLEKSHDHILDSILKASNMNKNFWELSSLLFSGVLKHTPDCIMSELTYVRYILVYKMWKRVAQGPEEKKAIVNLASLRLQHPPQLVEKSRAGFLNGIIPKIPKKRSDVTMFLIRAKFDVREKAKAFLKYIVESKTNIMFVPNIPEIQTDIPLLVGHLPDFGPSPNLVKLEPPEMEEDSSKVDVSGSRLMNEIWTSVNHEASFREAIRMQSVTTFNWCEEKLPEKKKMQRVLRKGRVKKSLASKTKPDVCQDKTLESISCDTIVLSDDSDMGGDVEKEVYSKTVKKKSKEHYEEKSGRRSLNKSSKKVLQREPTPPPVVESPSSPPRPSHNVCALTPSQIKQEGHDDDVILNMPLPQKYGDISKETPFQIQNAITTRTKAERGQDTSLRGRRNQGDEKATGGGVVIDTLCDVKQEKQSPTKEDEVNIGINRGDLLDIKLPGDYHNGSSRDQVIKLSESPSLEVGNMTDTDMGGAQSVSSLGRREEDNRVPDEEESSWSPPGGNQEFMRRVVTDLISTYSPDDEVDNSLIEGNVPSGNAVRNQIVDDDFHLDPFESVPESSPAEPPAKRSRVEEVVPAEDPSVRQTSSEMGSPARVGDSSQALASHSNESTPPIAELPDLTSLSPKQALHAVTLHHHHTCYTEQARFRDLCTTFQVKPEDEVPSAFFRDEATGCLTQGCDCDQCSTNFSALYANVKCLVQFKAQTMVTMENDLAKAKAAANAEPLNQFEEKQDKQAEGVQGCACDQCSSNFPPLCANVNGLVQFEAQTLVSMENDLANAKSSMNAERRNQFEENQVEQADQDGGGDADMGEISGAGGEASVQLPFKKRKAFSGRDDGESQHSNASKEEGTEPRPWPIPDEYPSHTPTRMFSIAALEYGNDFSQASASLSGSFMYRSAAVPHFAPSTLATTIPAIPDTAGEVSFSQNSGLLQTAPSTGGGFPPFSSVVPPENRPQPSYETVDPVPQYPPVYSSYQQPLSDPDSGRRHFRTPAEMKATFHADPAPEESPWTQGPVNGAYFTRNLSSGPSTPPPETKTRSRKKDSSRKSKKSSRKRK